MNTVETYTYYIYIPLLVVSAAACVVLAVASWHRRPTPGAVSLAAMMVAGAFWGLAYALELSFREPGIRALFGEIKYLGIVAIPYLWLIFALRYTGRAKCPVSRRGTGLVGALLLAIFPLVTATLALTNGAHHLIRSYQNNLVPGAPPEVVPGPWFWLHSCYSYLLLLVGTFLLLSTLFRRSRLYRGQGIAVAIGSLVPWATNVVYVMDVKVLGDLDPTPYGFALTGGVLLWGCLRSRLLDLIPIARETIVEEMAEGMIVADKRGKILDTNRAAQVILGLSGSAASRKELSELLPELCIFALFAAFRKPAQEDDESPPEKNPERAAAPLVREVHLGKGENRRCYEAEISPLRSGSGVPVEVLIIVLRDATERKKAEAALAESQKQLSYQAFHDPLTELPNRYLLESLLEKETRTQAAGEQDESYLAILFMDLDGFKKVNDSLGHTAGDELLCKVAERLTAAVRDQDTVARFGGDEFCVLLSGISGAEEAVWVTERLGSTFSKPFKIGAFTVRDISASIGVAVGRQKGWDRSLDELVREADAAMYRAKSKAGKLYEVVDLDEELSG